MKNFKKFIAILFCLTAVFAASAFAEGGDVKVQYNGRYLEFSDVSPVIIDGRTMLPFRGVFEQMGAAVDFDDEARTAKANFNGNEIRFCIDESEIYSENGTLVYTMDVSPVIENGRTLVPVRAVAEAWGLIVGWDEKERTVVIFDEAALRRELESNIENLDEFKALIENPAKVYTQTETAKITSDYGAVMVLKSETTSDGENRRILCNLSEYSFDAVVDLIITADALYLKTDMFENAAALDDEQFKTLAKVFPADKWFKADMSELETYISGSDSGVLSMAMGDKDFGLYCVEEWIESCVSTMEKIFEENDIYNSAEFAREYIEYAKNMTVTVDLTNNADGTVTAKIAMPYMISDGEDGEKILYNTYTAVYSSGVPISAEIDMRDNINRLEVSSSAEVGGMVEKIILPEKTANFVDTLYTLMNM